MGLKPGQILLFRGYFREDQLSEVTYHIAWDHTIVKWSNKKIMLLKAVWSGRRNGTQAKDDWTDRAQQSRGL
jgi:hypothetical protein